MSSTPDFRGTPGRLPNSARNVLTAARVRSIRKRGLYPDGGNLYLQVGQNGGKSWIFRYALDGRTRNMGLGPLVDVSLADARRKAAQCREQLRNELDPLDERRKARQARREAHAKQQTFRECAAQYIAAKRTGWSEKHAAQWDSTLETYAYPTIGNLLVSEITTAQVEAILKPIWNAKRETANRVRGRIEKVLDRASALNLREGDNPARWQGNLKELFEDESGKSRRKRVKHLAALAYAELPAFMTELRKLDGIAPIALEVVILTATRTGEVIGARWREIDLDSKVWNIPALRMKNGFSHRVPLSDAAVAAFRKLPDLGEGWVFPGHKHGTALSNMAMLQLLKKRMNRHDITVHGFRSTFRDWIAEQTNYPNILAEKALAHVVGDKTEAAYRRGDMLERRRVMMDEWARYAGAAV